MPRDVLEYQQQLLRERPFLRIEPCEDDTFAVYSDLCQPEPLDWISRACS